MFREEITTKEGIRLKICYPADDLLYAFRNAFRRRGISAILKPMGISAMLSFSWKKFQCLFISRHRTEDSRQIAEKTARLCLDKALKRLHDSETWSAAELRGYLRATATPWVDSALEKLLPSGHRSGSVAAEIKALSLSILEQLVLQKLHAQPVVLRTKSAA
jgi:hypothetical protein